MGLQRKVAIVASAVALTALVGGAARAQTPLDPPDTSDESTYGAWELPFVEPMNGAEWDKPGSWCPEQTSDEPTGEPKHQGKNVDCVPTAGSMAILGGPNVVYWDALEDMEEVEAAVAAEFGNVSVNDQTRELDIAARTWSTPTPVDGGATADTHPLTPVASDEKYNDGALFCAALTFLPDGRVLAVGGTAYYSDPSVPGTKYGVAELEGLDNARIFDPKSHTWTQAGEMKWGRWYPTAVPLADGRVFVASGVTKLIKPLYTDGRSPADNGRNVVQTETYDPAAGTWTENTGGDRSLPLFPRLHLIPGGRVYFNSAGQVFNPMGYAYDELTWNLSGFYDPATKTWADGGIPGLGTPAPGFRGSTFSVMLPLEPNDDGVYDKARLLTAGGIIGTSPGTYFAVSDSRIDTVTRDSTDVTSTSTGSLNQPRWYGNGVLTPTGEVIVFSGASADEVAGPGSAMPVVAPELFDGESWHKLAPANQKRTYHNTAALLPDGRILVGGHAPIATMYGAPRTMVPGVTSPGETRNPTFEIYSPPYLFRGDRPVIRATEVNNLTKNLEIALDPAHNRSVTSVVLMRRTAITHLIDGGQRAVKLDFTQNGSTIHARMPNDASVLPPGPYLLFVNGDTDKGETPSVAAEITLDDTTAPQSQAVASSAASDREVDRDLRAAGAVPVRAELAYHEIAEMAGHHHASSASSSGGGDSGVPWPAWPAGAAITLVGFWAVTGRVPRKLTRTG